MKTKLTKRSVERAKAPKGGVVYYWDSTALAEGKGSLGLRLASSGARTWCVQTSPVGSRQPLRRAIGDAKVMGLEAAKVEAARVAEQLRAGAAADVADRPPVRTLGALLDRFIAEHGATVAPSTLEMYKLARQNILAHLPAGTRVEHVTVPVLYEVYRRIGGDRNDPKPSDRPVTADHLRATIGKAWTWAQSAPVGALDMALVNPTVQLGPKYGTKKRGKSWTRSELEAIGKALAKAPEGPAKVATLVRMLSGWRGAEVCSLKWQDIGESGVVTLEKTKTGDRLACLPTIGEHFIRALPRVSEYVFPASHGKTPHLTRNGLNQAWRRDVAGPAGLKGQARYANCARKTYTSIGSAFVGDDILRTLTGHAVEGSHSAYLEVIEDTREHADRIAGEIAGRLKLFPEGGRVVSIASRRAKAGA